MHTFFRFAPVATALLLASMAAPVTAGEHVIAVPRAVTGDQGRMIHSALSDIVMRAAPGDTIRVIDATATETIAVFTIPEDGRAEVPNLRRRALAEPLDALNRFVRGHYIDAPVTAPADAGSILLPQLLDNVAHAYGHVPAARRTVCMLVIGSARYRDPREPGFDMVEGRFPADGLIVGSSQTQSPYGVLDRQGHLQGVYINMLTLDTDLPSDVYALRIWRTWQLHTHGRGGTLVTYTNDPSVALQRFTSCERTPTRSFSPDSTRANSSMITIDRVARAEAAPAVAEVEIAPSVPDPAPVEQPVSVAIPVDAQGNEDWLRSNYVVASNDPPEFERANLQLGIRWGDEGCAAADLDLHVRSGARPFLFFGNTSTDDGVYHKDHTSAPDVTNGLEYVTFTDMVALADLDIRVNFYSGTCRGGPRGLTRAYLNGMVFELPFAIEAESGNQGGNRDTPNDAHWVRIDPEVLFNLR